MSGTDMTVRFLLPCTMNGDREAIIAAMKVASLYGAILVPLSLRDTGMAEAVSLETQVPAHDFLEDVQQQAAIMKVPIEWMEISTHDASRSIHVVAEEMNCSGILLFVREGKGVLLESKRVQDVIEHERIILPFLVRLIDRETPPSPVTWLSRWFQGKNPFPWWYPFALLVLVLIVAALVCLDGLSLLREPVFTLASLLVKLLFVCVITYSLVAILTFFAETWRQKQE